MTHASQKRFRRVRIVVLLVAHWSLAVSAWAIEVQDWVLPTMAEPAAQPDLATDASGGLLLSWVEKAADPSNRLRFSRFTPAGAASSASGETSGKWQPVRTIASGNDWFVNWADTPHLVVLPDGSLWAHWLRRNGAGTYNYGIALVRSEDDGVTWSPPIRVEPDGTSNDYGFVSMWPQGRDKLGIAWLDSRQKPPPGSAQAHHHDSPGGPPMMLRAAVFDAKGQRVAEWPLDGSTCDCCPTSVALSDRGPVVVYRGRTSDEIRDTRLVRFDGKAWTRPVNVHADGWKFAGCPVNGPAVAARGDTVWAAWYTEAEGQPSLRLARSRDAGDHFEAPLRVAEGRSVLGRVALAVDDKTVWIAWLAEREGEQAQELWLARIDAASGKLVEQQRIAELTTRGRSGGMPKLQVRDGSARLIWTDRVDGKFALRGISAR